MLWKQSSLTKSAFIEAILIFTTCRTRNKLAAKGLNQKTRILRVPFSETVDIHSRISRLQKPLYQKGMLHTKEDLWAATCARCFGPAEGEEPTNEDFFSLFCMDGNFQQRHNTEASKDSPQDNEYPPIFVKPADIHKNEVSVESTAHVNVEGGVRQFVLLLFVVLLIFY